LPKEDYLVYDPDAIGKELMVRLLAHRAVDTAGLAVKIAWRLGDSCPVNLMFSSSP
jgi:predicted fused transcriptional regulator/phosphomethylpyrimidine kinase